MDYFEKTRNVFTAYVRTVIQNASIDYKRKVLKLIEKEIAVSDFTSLPKELLSHDDNSFLFEQDVTHSNIEKLFTDKKHYQAMKKLSDKEKLVLFLTVVEERPVKQVAEIIDITEENVRMIKSRAIKHFLKCLEDEI